MHRLSPVFLSLLLLLGALTGAARATVWETGNPPGVHRWRPQSAVWLSGRVTVLVLHGRHDRAQVIRLLRPYRLDEALPLPAGDWTDLTVILDGEAQVWVDDSHGHPLQATALTVALEDPQARTVHLSFSLPAELIATLQAELDPLGLADALQDGALASPAP